MCIRDRVGDAEDASDALACELRYPGCFACGVMGLCEVGDDPYDERLEVCIPAELARVCLTVGRYDPAEVARPVSYTHLDVYKRQT